MKIRKQFYPCFNNGETEFSAELNFVRDLMDHIKLPHYKKCYKKYYRNLEIHLVKLATKILNKMIQSKTVYFKYSYGLLEPIIYRELPISLNKDDVKKICYEYLKTITDVEYSFEKSITQKEREELKKANQLKLKEKRDNLKKEFDLILNS